MKSLFAFRTPTYKGPVGFTALATLALSLVLMTPTPAAAQRRGGGGVSGANGALFHGMTHPLGGFSAGYGPGTVNRNYSNRGFGVGGDRRGVSGYPYAYSYFVPDYFDYLDFPDQYPAYGYPPAYGAPPVASAYYASPGGVAASQQPVIINQYFGNSGPQQVTAPEANTNNTKAPGDPLGPPENYYLIAYKNHAVYPALAYWVEDKTLHYVTTQNTHNQASLDLIDLTRTKELNQGRDVPFSIPGQ